MTKGQTRTRGSVPDVLPVRPSDYGRLVSDISGLLEQGRRTTVKIANSIITTTYWKVGRRIVEFEQGGKDRAAYGEQLLVRLADDLTARHGRGYSRPGLQRMRSFYLGWEICSTPSSKLEARAKCQTLSGESSLAIVQTVSGQSAISPISSAESLEETLRREVLTTQRALETRGLSQSTEGECP
jgi:hypothetical protein